MSKFPESLLSKNARSAGWGLLLVGFILLSLCTSCGTLPVGRHRGARSVDAISRIRDAWKQIDSQENLQITKRAAKKERVIARILGEKSPQEIVEMIDLIASQVDSAMQASPAGQGVDATADAILDHICRYSISHHDRDTLLYVFKKCPPYRINSDTPEMAIVAAWGIESFDICFMAYRDSFTQYARHQVGEMIERAFWAFRDKWTIRGQLRRDEFVADAEKWFVGHRKELTLNRYYHQLSAPAAYPVPSHEAQRRDTDNLIGLFWVPKNVKAADQPSASEGVDMHE